MKHPLITALGLALMLTSCEVVAPYDTGVATVGVGVGYCDTLPSSWNQPYYYYNNRYYYGGTWQPGRYYHGGRYHDGRYSHHGQYIYGGRYDERSSHSGHHQRSGFNPGSPAHRDDLRVLPSGYSQRSRSGYTTGFPRSANDLREIPSGYNQRSSGSGYGQPNSQPGYQRDGYQEQRYRRY